MSEHCSSKTTHTKRRGKIHCCDWCGQKIELGERYETWLYFDIGSRTSVFAHKECGEAWDEAVYEEGGMVHASRDGERPKQSSVKIEGSKV